jgi:hypothetical protein
VRLKAHELRAVAVAASCDPRTVVRYVAGKSGQDLVGKRIEAALVALGLGRAARARRAAVGKLSVVP